MNTPANIMNNTSTEQLPINAPAASPFICEIMAGLVQYLDNPNSELKTDLGKTLRKFFSALSSLADRKQQDYGDRNLTDFGLHGVLVRANDKLQRLKNLMNSGQRANNESLLDTWSDLCNYAAIGFLMEARIWPLSPETVSILRRMEASAQQSKEAMQPLPATVASPRRQPAPAWVPSDESAAAEEGDID